MPSFDTKCGPTNNSSTDDDNLMFTFSEWDHKQFWDIWETSKKRTEIIDNYWNPNEIKIKTFILNKPQQDLFLL